MRYDSRECDLRKQKLGMQSGGRLPRHIDLAVQKKLRFTPCDLGFFLGRRTPLQLNIDFCPCGLEFLLMNTSGNSSTPPLPPISNEVRQWLIILHLSALTGFIIVGFGHILGPLIIWLLKRGEFPEVDAAGKNVLNFQVSWSLWMGLSWLIGVFGSCLIVPMALPVITTIAWIIYMILGAVKASDGIHYNYPLTIKFL